MARRQLSLLSYSRPRYATLASLGYQLGAIVGGAFAPVIATFLWAEYSVFWVAAYMAFASILTIISVAFLSETYKTSLTEESQ